MRTCKKCGETKELDAFHACSKVKKDGRKSVCKACRTAEAKVHYEANKESESERKKVYYAANKDRVRARTKSYYEANIESRRAYHRQWHQDNPDKTNRATASRRAAKLQRTPPWADTKAMTAIYAHAKFLEKITGLEHHVDHIVPLQSPVVSGLHVENNLQCIPASVNLSKSNSFNLEAQ